MSARMINDLHRDPLDPAHRQALVNDSAIDETVVVQRGYRTVHTKAALAELGFGRSQQRVPALLIPIYGPNGEIATYQVRPDAPRINKQGKPVKYEIPAGSTMVLDAHPNARACIADPSIPLFVTEGVKKGDALVSRGCCAVALLGVWNWRGTNGLGGKTALPEWESIALNDRPVYIVFDSDVMTKPNVYHALVRLKAFLESRQADVRLIYLPAGEGGSKVGVDDFLAAGHSLDDALALATPTLRPSPEEDGALGDDARSQAERLVTIGLRTQLFHDPTRAAFTVIEIDGHREVWPVQSETFRRWLGREYYQEEQRVAASDALRSGVEHLAGVAQFDGPERVLHNRLARHDDAIIYDLADGAWRTVRVTADDWEIETALSACFRRQAHQAAQVAPERGGDLWDLIALLNVAPDHQLLLLVWLVAAFVPDIPRPILLFHGGKGTGKSAGQKMLRRLIDPSEVEALTLSNDPSELSQQLDHHYAPIYENVDRLSAATSDALCRAVTGEGFTKRALYTNDEDVIRHYRRVIQINGINVVARRPDLLDRCLLVHLEQIPRDRRRTEEDLWSTFEAARPRLLGAALDVLSGALAIAPTIELGAMERMADFTRFGCAVAEVLGAGAEAFLAAYRVNVGTQAREAAGSSIVAEAVLALMDTQSEWIGTPTELLVALEEVGERASLFRRNSNGKVEIREFPTRANVLSRRLNEVRAVLEELGVVVRPRHSGDRTITITKLATDPTDTVQTVQIVQDSGPSVGSLDDVDGPDDPDATADAEAWEEVIP